MLRAAAMVDNFALFVPHFLLVIAIWRLSQRDDLDRIPEIGDPAPRQPASEDASDG